MGLTIQTERHFKEFSTIGVGGKIAFFAEVKTLTDLQEGLSFAKKNHLPFFILGKGSNCLFRDEPYTGLVLLNKIDFCSWSDMEVEVGAGYSFSLLGSQSARKGLCGLEFASGIPASVGGAIFMNAGANQSEASDLLKSVIFVHADGRIVEYEKNELEFRYRYSSFQEMKGAIFSSKFIFTEKNGKARRKQIDLIKKRKLTQPLQEKSIGCIFRNPDHMSAGALIEKCDLKGLKRGGARVSELHANFILNQGNASSSDITALIEEIQKRVQSKTGVVLQPEVWKI